MRHELNKEFKQGTSHLDLARSSRLLGRDRKEPILVFLYLQREDDAHRGEKQREEGPWIEPGDCGGLNSNASVFEIV